MTVFRFHTSIYYIVLSHSGITTETAVYALNEMLCFSFLFTGQKNYINILGFVQI